MGFASYSFAATLRVRRLASSFWPRFFGPPVSHDKNSKLSRPKQAERSEGTLWMPLCEVPLDSALLPAQHGRSLHRLDLLVPPAHGRNPAFFGIGSGQKKCPHQRNESPERARRPGKLFCANLRAHSVDVARARSGFGLASKALPRAG